MDQLILIKITQKVTKCRQALNRLGNSGIRDQIFIVDNIYSSIVVILL